MLTIDQIAHIFSNKVKVKWLKYMFQDNEMAPVQSFSFDQDHNAILEWFSSHMPDHNIYQ